MNNNIVVRYGASVELTVEIDDNTAVSASIYVGKEGEVYEITKSGFFVDGVADITLEPNETEIPIGDYKYQINVTYTDGKIDKYPEKNCLGEVDLPYFIVLEALDETEVIS